MKFLYLYINADYKQSYIKGKNLKINLKRLDIVKYCM